MTEADSEPLLTLQVHRDGDEFMVKMQTTLADHELAQCAHDVSQMMQRLAISVAAQAN